jgi:broad specificity phosphatase PhoE
MNRVFYIFRHGETDWNKEKRCQGHTDIALNETGIIQARELAQKISKFSIEHIYTSDLSRAQKTGEIVAIYNNIPMTVDSRLREMSYGEAEGLAVTEIANRYGSEVWQKLQSFKRENDHIGLIGGETRFQARTRFLELLNEIIKNTTHQKIGISTHGGALRNVLHYFLPEDHQIISIPNCVVYELHYISETQKFVVNFN